MTTQAGSQSLTQHHEGSKVHQEKHSWVTIKVQRDTDKDDHRQAKSLNCQPEELQYSHVQPPAGRKYQ